MARYKEYLIMAMNAGQIREALGPMAQFAPAVLAAADIVSAAEAAEQRVKDAEAKLAAVQKQGQDADAVRVQYEQQAIRARNDYHALMDKLEDEKATLQASIQPIKDAQAAATADQAQAIAAKQTELANVNQEIASAQSMLDSIKAEIDRLKKQFAA